MFLYLQTRSEMDSAADPGLLKEQMDDLSNRMEDLRDEINELSRDFEITEKPR